MIYNNIINHLKLWCRNKAEVYQNVYCGYGGTAYVGFQAAYELEFKLSALMDRSFESTEALKSEILGIIDVHYEPALAEPQNSTAKHIIDKTKQEFCGYLDELLSKNEALSLADVPYTRVIVGPEAASLQNRFRSVWGYVNTSYWYPLTGNEPEEIPEKFFVMLDCLRPYMKQLEQLLGLPQTHVYSYGENDFRPPNCVETVELNEYGGLETIYTDRDFSWAIYFSHEDTVAFAGSIVPKVRALLASEKDRWNKYYEL